MFTGEQTPEERDRVAAQEFEAAIAPVMEYMRQHLPEASTPEEAARIWAENQGEITPDPKGGSYVAGDAFDADARVYYRLLRRDYEKNPRPVGEAQGVAGPVEGRWFRGLPPPPRHALAGRSEPRTYERPGWQLASRAFPCRTA